MHLVMRWYKQGLRKRKQVTDSRK